MLSVTRISAIDHTFAWSSHRGSNRACPVDAGATLGIVTEFIENPALDPTRPWARNPALALQEDLVVVEAGMLLRELRSPGAAAIVALARSAVPVTAAQLAEQLGDTDDQAVTDAISQANLFAEAFGYLPLVQHDERGYYLDAAAGSVVLATTES